MKYAILLAMLMGTLGCGKKPEPAKLCDGCEVSHSMFHSATPEQIIAAWQTKAKAKKLYWLISCADGSDSFLGEAWINPGDQRYYIEDGGKPSWLVMAYTQEDAAAKLSSSVDLPPNFQPKSRVVERRNETEKHKMCPPELSGGPQ